MSLWNRQELIYFYYSLSWMYIYRPMFHTVGIAHIWYFWEAHCRSAENIMMTRTMISNRRRTGYLRTVTFGSVYKPLHITVQQYFCTLSHSQQFVQAATQHVTSTEQKFLCVAFHWSGGTVTVVKQKICHSVHECQHICAISLIYR